MENPELAEYFRKLFLEDLVKQGARFDDMQSLGRIYDHEKSLQALFSRWDKLGREIFLVKKVGFVNIHVRSEPPGFWGITKQVVKDFDTVKKHLKLPCYFVLLVGWENAKDVNGYILEDPHSPPMIRPPSEQTHSFKINEPYLDSNSMIRTSPKVAAELVNRGRDKFPNGGTVIRRRKS